MRGRMISLTVFSPKVRMPSSSSFSSSLFMSLRSRACDRSSIEMSSAFSLTTLLTMPVPLTRMRDSGENKRTATHNGPDTITANVRLLLVAYSLGITSPKSRMRKVNITVCTRKSTTALLNWKIWFIAKFSTMTIITFTRLLPIRMVERRRSGLESSHATRLR